MLRALSIALAGMISGALPMNASTPEIVVLGDSLTAGYGLRPEQAFPALLQAKIQKDGLKWRVINAGRSGDTTAEGLRRVDSAVSASTKILVIALGANDGLRQISPTRIAANLEAIVTKARKNSRGIRIVLAGMHMPADWVGSQYSTAYDAAFADIAKSQNLTFLPYLLDRVGGIAALNQPDKLHPTAAGQQIIAETVWKVLLPLL